MNTRQTHLTLDQVSALISIGDRVDDLADELSVDGVATGALAHYANACQHISEAANALLNAMDYAQHPINQASKCVVLSLCADDAHDLAHLLEQGPRELQVTVGRDGLMVGTLKVAEADQVRSNDAR